jgi:hypothetical protein
MSSDHLNAASAFCSAPQGETFFDSAWRTSTVLAIAQGIVMEGAFDRMPILADALQDAGCDRESILNHCRGSTDHSSTCWVLALILSTVQEAVQNPQTPQPTVTSGAATLRFLEQSSEFVMVLIAPAFVIVPLVVCTGVLAYCFWMVASKPFSPTQPIAPKIERTGSPLSPDNSKP